MFFTSDQLVFTKEKKWATQTSESEAYLDSSCRNFFASLLWQVFTRGWEGFPKILGKITNNCETNRCFCGSGTYSNAFGFWCHAEIVHTALHSPKKICKGPMQNNRACPDSSVLQNALNEVLTFRPLTCCPLNFQFKKRSEIRCFCGKQNIGAPLCVNAE